MSNAVKKKGRHGLLIGMILYAVLFLGLAAGGLYWFWGYIEAYELSRPKTTMEAYMEQLQFDTLYASAKPLVDQVDHSLQTEQQCREFMEAALSGGISYARKLSECTKDKNVYMLLSGGKTIGKVTLTAQPADQYGFTPWEVAEESFDFSYLLGTAATITAPHDYAVYVGEYRLGSDYVTQEHIQYEALKEFYDDYSLPYLVTYKAGPIFGYVQFRVTDPAGAAVVIDERTDPNRFLDNCTEEEKDRLKGIVHDFIGSYVDFTSCTGNDSYGNYRRLAQHMVSGGALAKRMHNALDGLYWVSDRGAKISDITIHRSVSIGSDRYLCDVTYVVDTTAHSGAVQTTSNVKLILLKTDNGLKAEAMVSY